MASQKAQKVVLEDLLNEHILSKLDTIRKQRTKILFEVPEQGPASVEMAELHYEIAMQYFASLDLVVPTMKLHLEVIMALAKRYALLGSKVKGRDIKEWASTEAASLRCMVVHILHLCKRSATSRSPTVTFLKTFVMDLKLKGGDDPSRGVEAALQAAVMNEDPDSAVATPSSTVSSHGSGKKNDVKVCPCPDDFETQLMEMLEGEVPTEAAGEVMHKDGSRRQAEKDRAPLEASKPELPESMELAAAEAWKGADVCEAPGDPYTAQLAKSRAAKVDSAEKLLARAKADPKVQKVLKKPKTTKSTGDTKGRGSSKTPKVPLKVMELNMTKCLQLTLPLHLKLLMVGMRRRQLFVKLVCPYLMVREQGRALPSRLQKELLGNRLLWVFCGPVNKSMSTQWFLTKIFLKDFLQTRRMGPHSPCESAVGGLLLLRWPRRSVDGSDSD